MNYNNLPNYIKENGLFCLWKYEQRGESKPTKVPYQVNGNKALPNNPSTFTTFDTALKEVNKFDGLGIGIFNGISAIDIDHCVDEDGNLSELAENIVALFKGSYVEYSPSGIGLRIIFLTSNFQYDKAKYYINNQSIGLEVYVSGATNKYVTVTGDDYTWQPSTVSHILARQEYLGHTVNFKTYRKSYKNKKMLKNDPSEWQIFENTHEAIIDKETFDIVQRIRDGRRRLTPMGEMPILSGMLFCADCGNKLYQVRARGWEHDKEHFVCATYRKIKGGCSSHQIRNVVVEELLLDGIKQITAFATEHESEFVQMVTKKTQAELNRSLRDSKKELELAQARITKLDSIIQRLYEDNIEGKISDERFAKMSANYEDEQNTLTMRIAELETLITNENENSDNTDRFLAIVRKYTHITELTAALIREFVEKIYVYKAERIDGKKVQRIKIIWNCIGEINMPPNAENEKSA